MTTAASLPNPPVSRRRVFSEAFINRKIAEVDALHEKLREHIPVLPEPSDDRYFGSRLYQECRAVAKHRYDTGYVDGFWMGWCLRDNYREKSEAEVSG